MPESLPEDALFDDANAARVGVSLTVKINLGDYESAELSVWTTLPCAPEEWEAIRAKISRSHRQFLKQEAPRVRRGFASGN
jgi:hypothetical protein